MIISDSISKEFELYFYVMNENNKIIKNLKKEYN